MVFPLDKHHLPEILTVIFATFAALAAHSKKPCGPRTMLRYEAGLLSLGTLRQQYPPNERALVR